MILEDRVAVVTGASSGIGKAIALKLAKDGANVAVHYYSNKVNAEQVVDHIRNMGRKAITVYANLTKTEDVAPMSELVWSSLGPVDILVNNTGAVLNRIKFLETHDEFWEEVFHYSKFSLLSPTCVTH